MLNLTDTSLQGLQMKTTKIQYFLWKGIGSDMAVMYAPSNATSEDMPYYSKNDESSNFYKHSWRSLTDLEAALKRNDYHFICSLLIPSDHTNEDLAKYYAAIKKNLSL